MPAKFLQEQIDYPAWANDRFKKLDWLYRVVEGTHYDHLQHPFYSEVDGGNNYIQLRERRPSVIYNLASVVVNRSTRLLFGGKHFPTFQTTELKCTEFLNRLTISSGLQATMLEASYMGSIGSVGIFFSILDNKVLFEVADARYCSPRFDATRELDNVLIMFPVTGWDLIACGYEISSDDVDENFFFAKRHTKTEEVLYQPIKTKEYTGESDLRRDPIRSTEHNLGFVPGVWIRNLWPTRGVDGTSTFEKIIPISIEIDYQLSQCGRGLKYNSDPQLLIKEPSGGASDTDMNAPVVRSANNAIFVGEEGDAKLLEISGQGQKAVMDFVTQIRQLALEVASSSRKDPETSYGNMSGRAMEILEGDLISLSSAKRLTYGEMGLKPLLCKILRAAGKTSLLKEGSLAEGKDFNIEFYWGNWFDPTPADLMQTEQALDLAVRGRRLFMHEGRMLSAGNWDVGRNDPQKLEEEWPIPEKPDIDPDKPVKPGAAGDDGRDAKVGG